MGRAVSRGRILRAVRYPAAIWKGPVPNQGGVFGAAPTVGVLHIMEGTLSGTDAWFHNPGSQVSAHFGVGKDGTIYQWVDTAYIAWHVAADNGYCIGIEHEGFTGDTLTEAQLVSTSSIMEWLQLTIPLVASTSRGWCGHGQLGVSGGNHPACPGSPILGQLPELLARAAGGPPAPKPPTKAEGNMIAATSTGNGYWCVTHDGAVYAYGDAKNVGQPFANADPKGRLQPGVVIVGIAGHGTAGYWLFASDGSVFAYGSAPFLGRPDRY